MSFLTYVGGLTWDIINRGKKGNFEKKCMLSCGPHSRSKLFMSSRIYVIVGHFKSDGLTGRSGIAGQGQVNCA